VKHRRNRAIILAMTLSALIAHASMAVESPTAKRASGKQTFFELHAAKLELSPQDLDAIEKLMAQSAEGDKALRAGLSVEQAKMKLLLAAPEPDFDALMAQADLVGQIEIQITKHKLATLLKVGELFTADQRRQIQELMAEERRRYKIIRDLEKQRAADTSVRKRKQPIEAKP
jgi:Spy/CpxP family protein refolding chaperone